MFISTYRQEARFALSGRWGKAILITLIASLFGAILVGSSFNINFEIDDKNLSALPHNALNNKSCGRADDDR